jgi:hypothetical protein
MCISFRKDARKIRTKINVSRSSESFCACVCVCFLCSCCEGHVMKRRSIIVDDFSARRR